jgi:hypothetical protein
MSEVGIVIISKSSSSGESFLRFVGLDGEEGVLHMEPSLSLPILGTSEALFLLGLSNGESSRHEDRRRSSSLDKFKI